VEIKKYREFEQADKKDNNTNKSFEESDDEGVFLYLFIMKINHP